MFFFSFFCGLFEFGGEGVVNRMGADCAKTGFEHFFDHWGGESSSSAVDVSFVKEDGEGEIEFF